MSKVIKKEDFYNPPNILTYLRLLCVPAFIAVFFAIDGAKNLNVYIAFGIFLFASVTDVLDGFIARRFNFITDLGKMLDPLADKLLQVSVAICLCVNDFIHHSQIGMLFIFFPIALGLKDGFMLFWGIILAKKKIIVHSNFFGKAAAVINTLGLLLSFFAKATYDLYRILATVVLALGTIAAYIALIDYSRKLYVQLDHTVKDKSDMNLKF
ncbi:MAG: CDP-alcohol phosphatidyltransferase family protein [Clostridia bacterium]|nr:CDP-alcohol phosphatidyltransferase family protein [Clostridia bacterium]